MSYWIILFSIQKMTYLRAILNKMAQHVSIEENFMTMRGRLCHEFTFPIQLILFQWSGSILTTKFSLNDNVVELRFKSFKISSEFSNVEIRQSFRWFLLTIINWVRNAFWILLRYQYSIISIAFNINYFLGFILIILIIS